MPIRFGQLLTLDHTLFKTVLNPMLRPTLIPMFSNSSVPYTGRALVMFITRSTYLKNGIYELIRSNNIYAIRVLYRALLKHFITYNYLSLRYRIEKNDNPGVEYYRYGGVNSDLAEYSARPGIPRLDLENEEHWKIFTDLRRDLTDIDRREFLRKAPRFNIDNLNGYITQVIAEKLYGNNHWLPLLFSIASHEIAPLRCYSHAGPNTEKDIALDSTPQMIGKNSHEVALISAAIFWYMVADLFAIAAIVDKQLEPISSSFEEQYENLMEKLNLQT